MDLAIKSDFLLLWNKFFGNAELPNTFYYSEKNDVADKAKPPKERSCLIGELAKVRKGQSLYFNELTLGCGGARRYLGYNDNIMPDFEFFLSCGIPGKMEGERYVRTPEMVREIQKNQKTLPIAGKNIVFKRWDKLNDMDTPEVVIFFAKPDVLSGLFTLANFDQTEPNTTFAPFGAGCGSIIHYPYLEKEENRPRAVIGMFDPSARPFVPSNILTFAVPMIKFIKMIGYMNESFLITDTWETIKNRINKD